MSWLEEDFTGADEANKKLKSVERQIAKKWFDTFPADVEGSEGEVRYIYTNGMPIICVKMNGEWHFMPMQTIGKAGAYRNDDGGLTADMLQDYMPNEPAYDSSWRQLLPLNPGDYAGAGDFVGYDDSYPSNGNSLVSSGMIWPYIDTAYTSSQATCYLVSHNLGLSRPPKNVSIYIADAPADSQHSVDTFLGEFSNCLNEPYDSLQDAINDGMLMITRSLIDEGYVPNSLEIGGNSSYNGRHKSIFIANPAGSGKPSSVWTAGPTGNITCATVIISPNDMIVCCQWPIGWGGLTPDFDTSSEYMGFQNMEWMRIFIWR